LIAPDYVLTTAHCFCKGSKSCKTSASDFQALVGSEDYASTIAIDVKSISIHPSWNGDPSNGWDFASVHLAEVATTVTDQAKAVPIVISQDRYCYDALVQAYSWDDDQLGRINGNTSDDQVGARLVNMTNSGSNSSTTYSWPGQCIQSNCEPTQVVARGTTGSFCDLNDGAPLLLAGGPDDIGLVGLYSWSLRDSKDECLLKLKDGSTVSQFFAQASAAIPFLEAQGIKLRIPLGSVCGDSHKSLYEQCDDGNTHGGDGCSANCTIEHGFQCSTYHKSNDEQCWRSQCSSLSESGDGSGMIIGIVAGCIAGVMVICAVPTVIIRRRRKEKAAAAAATRATPAPPAAAVAEPAPRNARRTTRKAPEDLPTVTAANDEETLASTPVTALKRAPPPTPAADPIWAGSPTAPPTTTLTTVDVPEDAARILTPAALRLETPPTPASTNPPRLSSATSPSAGIVRPTPVRSEVSGPPASS
jgi:cysteine-rich repeat protein